MHLEEPPTSLWERGWQAVWINSSMLMLLSGSTLRLGFFIYWLLTPPSRHQELDWSRPEALLAQYQEKVATNFKFDQNPSPPQFKRPSVAPKLQTSENQANTYFPHHGGAYENGKTDMEKQVFETEHLFGQLRLKRDLPAIYQREQVGFLKLTTISSSLLSSSSSSSSSTSLLQALSHQAAQSSKETFCVFTQP